MKQYAVAIFELLRDAGMAWAADKASLLAAGLAYYTLFSLTPILVLLTVLGSRILQDVDVQETILTYVSTEVGSDVAAFIEEMFYGATNSLPDASASVVATIIGLGVLFWGASGVFNHLKRALNQIWGVEPEPRAGIAGIIFFVQTRLLSVVMVLGVGFLLGFSLVLKTVVTTLNGLLDAYMPELGQSLNSTGTDLLFLILPLIAFALIYKALPDAKLSWRDVWLGSLVTTILFSLGNYLLGIYMRVSAVGSAFGVAGGLIVFLIWVYYSAQIFFFGAEFTKVFANRYGSKVVPSDGAVAVRRELILNTEPELPREPVSLAVDFYDPEPTVMREQSRGQRLKQTGFGLLGLAVGLFLGYLGGHDSDT